MKFSVSRTDFAEALNNVSRAVPVRTTMPVLSGILLDAGEEKITLRATDLELGVECHVPADVTEAGALVLPARYLTDIVRHIPQGTLDITSNPANNTATINWGSSEFTIHGQGADEFPALPVPEDGLGLDVPVEELRNVIEGTLFAVSHDETRPILTGVQLSINGDRLQALSTDGFRIAHRQAPVSTQRSEPISLVVPGRNLGELLRLPGTLDTIHISVSANQVFFDLERTRLVSRLLDGNYPAVLDLVPRDYKTRIRVDRAGLHAACERVALLSDPLHKSYAITMSCGPDGLTLSASSAAVGKAREHVPAEVQGQEATIIFNARYLADGLKNCAAEEALIELSGPVTAARLTVPEEQGFLYVLMPMRPSEA